MEEVLILSTDITVSWHVTPCILVNGNYPQTSKYGNHDNQCLEKFKSHMDPL